MWQISGTVAWWSDARCEATVDLRPRQGGLRLTRLFDRPVAWGPLLLGPPVAAVPPLRDEPPLPSKRPAHDEPSTLASSVPGGAYVRGDDLIVAHPLDDLKLESSIYWRWLTAPAASTWVGFEWIGSYITRRAATTLDVLYTSDVSEASEILWGSATSPDDPPSFHLPKFPPQATDSTREWSDAPGVAALRMARRGGAEYSYVELTYPGDLGSSRLRALPTHAGSADATPRGWELRLAREQLEKGVLRRYRSRCLWVPGATDQAEALKAWAQFVNSAPPLET